MKKKKIRKLTPTNLLTQYIVSYLYNKFAIINNYQIPKYNYFLILMQFPSFFIPFYSYLAIFYQRFSLLLFVKLLIKKYH